jgi:hypothetical protein
MPDAFIQLFFHSTPKLGSFASSHFIFAGDATRCLPVGGPIVSLLISPLRRGQHYNRKCHARCTFPLNPMIATFLKNALDFAVARIVLSLGAFSNVVNDSKEGIGIDFFGSYLLPIQNVLS